jgi:hypothetical protein
MICKKSVKKNRQKEIRFLKRKRTFKNEFAALGYKNIKI